MAVALPYCGFIFEAFSMKFTTSCKKNSMEEFFRSVIMVK